MLIYLLKTTFCLLLFLGFYHLVLEKEKMHRFNRFYLLGSIVFAFLIPSFTITVSPTEFIEPIVQEYQMVDQMQITSIASAEKTEINYMNYVYGLYLLISGILLFYFVKSLHKILLKTRKNEKVNYYTATVILLKEKILPHTFLKYIFINKNEYINDKSEQLILTHELAHVKQKHSLDVLFIELLLIAFWFIPLFRFYKKAIQLNHEFLADDAVIKTHKNISEYQHLLLNVSTQENNIYLASNLNYSLTKKRLLMMTTPSSKTKILLKKLLVLPLTAGFIFAFAQRVEAQEKKNEKPQVVVVETEENGISEKEMIEYKALFNASEKTKIYKLKDTEKMVSLYIKMSKKQQQSVTDIRKVIAPPPPKLDLVLTYNKLAKSLQEPGRNLKENVEFLEKIYNLMDSSEKEQVIEPSKVLPPLPPEKDIIKNYKFLFNNLQKPSNEGKEHIKLLNYELRVMYTSMTPSQKKKVKNPSLLKPPTPPKSIIKELSEKEMELYKQLFNKGAKTKMYKQKDALKMISLYKRMSKKQQQSVTDIRKVGFPKVTFPPPPAKKLQEKVTFHKNWFITIDGEKYYYTFDKNERVERYYKDGKLVNLDVVKEYNKKHQIFERLKNTGKHYVFKTEEEQKVINQEFSDLGGIYFRMPKADKNKVSYPDNPRKPYVTLWKNGKKFYKKSSELTSEDKLLMMPPPPPPNASEEELKKFKQNMEAWKKRAGLKIPPPPPPTKKQQ